MIKLCDSHIHCGCSENIAELEAKLAKAVDVLRYYVHHDDDGILARTTLAELIGGKDD